MNQESTLANDVNNVPVVHGEKKPYVCRICDTLYLDRQCLQKHIKTAHADILPINFGVAAINELIKTDAPVEIKCEICCLVFECYELSVICEVLRVHVRVALTYSV